MFFLFFFITLQTCHGLRTKLNKDGNKATHIKVLLHLLLLPVCFPGIGCPVPRIPAEASPLADHVSATRILCGALVFPTIATIVGKLMFSSVNSNLQRTILVRMTLRTPVCQ